MRVAFRTLTNQRIELDVQDSDSVIDIKNKLHKEFDVGEAEKQTFILKGAILTNGQKFLKDFVMKETDFIIIMISKKKQKINEELNDQNIATKNKNEETITKEETEQASNTSEISENARVVSDSSATVESASHFIASDTSSENEPQNSEFESSQISNQTLPALRENRNPILSYLSNNNSNNQLNVMISPDEMRRLQSSGLSREEVMQAFAEVFENPQVAREYAEAFNNRRSREQLLNNISELIQERHPIPPSNQPSRISVAITQEDSEAIRRLELMGFSKIDCIQMYLACDKNENIAANLLCEEIHEELAQAVGEDEPAGEEALNDSLTEDEEQGPYDDVNDGAY